MSHIQDRLKSLSKAFRTFDTKEASFGSGHGETSIASSVSAGSHETEGSGGSQASEASHESPSERSLSEQSAESELSERSAYYKRKGLHQGMSLRTRTHNDPSVVTPEQQSQLPINSTPKKAKPKSKMFWIVLIVLGLLILFGVVLYLLYKKRKRAQEDGNTTKTKKISDPKRQTIRAERHVRFGKSSVVEPDVSDPFSQIDAIGAKVNRPTPVILLPEDEDPRQKSTKAGGDEHGGDGADGADPDIVPF